MSGAERSKAAWTASAAIVALIAVGGIAVIATEGDGDSESQTAARESTGDEKGGDAAPILLMFHAGGFLEGSPKLLEGKAVPLAERRGFTAVNVGYPLGDPEAALRAAQDATRGYGKRRRVCAYGESAGGLLAARLAQNRLGVDAAATYSPLADLTTYGDGFFAASERAQVIGRDSRAPILAMVAEGDDPAYTSDIRRWGRSDPKVRLLSVPGGHLGEEGEYGANVRRAMRWLAQRCT